MTEELEGLTCKELIGRLLELFESQNEEEVDECLDWFLFTYSPEHAFSLVQSNAEALNDPVLLDIIMTKVREIYEPEIFLETMNVISSIEGHEQEIAKSGACRAVVTMMGRDIHNARSQSLGCKVLANLAHDPEVCEWLGKVKAISRVIEALRRHQTSLDVSIECMRAMANLTYRCKPNKDITVLEHGIDAISDTMGLHKANVKLVNSALRALRNIVTLDSVMELQQHTLIHEVISCMNDHIAISEIQVHSIWILIGLISGKAETKRHLTEQGSLEPILRAMETHKADAQVQLAGATALALLSKISAHRNLIVKWNKSNISTSATSTSTTTVTSTSTPSNISGIRILIDALQNHRENVPVQRAAIKAIFRLSFNKAIRDQLAQHSIVSEIVESMKANPSNGPLQRTAIICLLQLAKTPSLRERVQHDAVACMIQARNQFVHMPHVLSIAHIAVESMISNSAPPTPTSVDPPPAGVESTTTMPSVAPPVSPRRIPEIDGLTTIASQLDGELRTLKAALKDKEKQVEALEATVAKLELLLVQLRSNKVAKSNETLPSSEPSSDQKQILSQLRQQNDALNNDLKKAKVAQDTLIIQLKEEEDKLQNLKNKKKQIIEERSKSDEEPSDTSDSSSEKSGDKEAKPKKTTTTKSKTVKGKKDANNKSPRVSLSSSSEEEQTADGDDSATTTTTTNSTYTTTTTTTINSVISPVRGLQRNTPSRPNASAEEILNLKKEFEELSQKFSLRENEVKEAFEEKQKLEQQLLKVNVELKGAHVLVTTLQKESLSQNAAREKITAGSSMWSRNQKKMKELKDREAELQKENEELKREQAASSKAGRKRKK